MKARSIGIILGITIAIIFSTLLHNIVSVQAETLDGVVLDQGNRPISGLTVSLAHPRIGRSSPVITDGWGRFFFERVPRVDEPYYIEVYWGNRLLYRDTLNIYGNVRLPPIILQRSQL